ncbi:MAG: biotin synthase BioB, partial [Porphyromonadaceae bacterium]|nr:biotin synthase BioB [Porphyromonadaceae bacterium]
MVNPRAFLRFSGGRAQLSPETQYKAIYVGINAAITGDLLTTIGRQAEDDMKMIKACGKVNTPEDWEVHYNY